MKQYDDQQVFFKALKDRSKDAYKELYRISFQEARKYILSKGGNRIDVKDLVQEAFIIFTRKIEQPGFTLQKQARVQDYLLGIVKICWRRWYEQNKRTRKALADQDISPEFIAEGEGQDLKKELIKALDLISENCHKLLMDYYFGRFALKDIALEMDYSNSFVKVKKHRCMQELKGILAEKLKMTKHHE